MLERLIGELQPMWGWLLTKLGWEGIQLSWIHILVLALAFVGALLILRNLLGGHSGGGGGSTVMYPSTERRQGLPTSSYTSSSKLGDFSISPRLYDFRVPTPTPDLSRLRSPLSLDLDKARELFVPAGRQSPDSLKEDDEEGEVAEQDLPAGTSWGRPNWELAMKLFVPRRRRK